VRCDAQDSREDVTLANRDQQSWVKNYQPGVPAEIDRAAEGLRRLGVRAGDRVAIQYTSGTTGNPKGARSCRH
jgi:long-subunit acyl-CoA synthetase (AMP-forming)